MVQQALIQMPPSAEPLTLPEGHEQKAEVLAVGMDFQLQTNKISEAPGPVSQGP